MSQPQETLPFGAHVVSGAFVMHIDFVEEDNVEEKIAPVPPVVEIHDEKELRREVNSTVRLFPPSCREEG
jgi:hypothetical protein